MVELNYIDMKRWGIKILTLAVIMPAFFVSCTKSGSLSGASTSGSSFSGSLNGSVNGGLSPVAGATVSVFAVGNSTPLASGTTTSSGAFTLNYTNPGGFSLLYVMVTGGNAGSGTNSKIQIGGILGLTSSVPTSIVLNEATTGALFNVAYNYGGVSDANGTVTFPAVNGAATANMIAQYNNLISNGSMNGSLSTTNQNKLATMANAVAACIENASNCGTLFNNATNTNLSAAISIQDALYNMVNPTTANLTNLYSLASPLASNTGFSMPGSNQTVLNIAPIVTTQTIPVGSGPAGIAIDALGNLYVSNNTGNTVTKLNSSGSTVTTFSGLTGADGIAIDSNGNLWIGSNSGGVTTVAELNSSGTTLGTFTIGAAPRDVAIDSSGNVWVTSQSNGNVTELNSSGTSLGTFTVGPTARGIAMDASGQAWIANNSSTVTRLSPSGSISGNFSVAGNLTQLAFDPSGNLWVGTNGTTIVKLSPSGTTLGTFTTGNGVQGVAIDSNGSVWTGNFSANNVTKLNPSGKNLGTFSVGTNPIGVAIDASGNVWVANNGTNNLTQISGVTLGPNFFPYSGPQWPTSGF